MRESDDPTGSGERRSGRSAGRGFGQGARSGGNRQAPGRRGGRPERQERSTDISAADLATLREASGAAPAADGKPARKGAGFALSLKGRALRYLAAREHSRAELERKLAPHEETPGQLAAVLDDLQAKDFINEARVVESVVHRRAPRLGAARVRQELQAKGLAPQAVAEAVAGLQATEHERALALWRRKFGEPPIDAKERARQARFLMSRGFSGGVVARVLRTGHGDDFDD